MEQSSLNRLADKYFLSHAEEGGDDIDKEIEPKNECFSKEFRKDFGVPESETRCVVGGWSDDGGGGYFVRVDGKDINIPFKPKGSD